MNYKIVFYITVSIPLFFNEINGFGKCSFGHLKDSFSFKILKQIRMNSYSERANCSLLANLVHNLFFSYMASGQRIVLRFLKDCNNNFPQSPIPPPPPPKVKGNSNNMWVKNTVWPFTEKLANPNSQSIFVNSFKYTLCNFWNCGMFWYYCNVFCVQKWGHSIVDVPFCYILLHNKCPFY